MNVLSPRHRRNGGQKDAGRDAKYFNKLADAARNSGKFLVASVFYEEVLRRSPKNAAIHIQCGHMLKEAGDLEAAGRHYSAAEALTPNDPDLQLQLGHYHKLARRNREAIEAYKRAIILMPEWNVPQDELTALSEKIIMETKTKTLLQRE